MKKITEYKILEDDFRENLVKMVNQSIGEGWQPYGDLIVYVLSNTSYCFCQAMIKID
jgi:hypothetical protein